MNWGDIVLTDVPGGVRVDRADETSAISLVVLAQTCSHFIRVEDDRITIADQVVYQVTGYSFENKALLVRLVEDRRSCASGATPAAVGA
ncbi:hypothetical protein ACFWYW_55810 [Nonomuraea sp. NPDC059023]|uniref:hypothetical protein n=1 Tax=unclassified Nonomuraea TaxID=2593643 RepID=UPI00367D78E3